MAPKFNTRVQDEPGIQDATVSDFLLPLLGARLPLGVPAQAAEAAAPAVAPAADAYGTELRQALMKVMSEPAKGYAYGGEVADDLGDLPLPDESDETPAAAPAATPAVALPGALPPVGAQATSQANALLGAYTPDKRAELYQALLAGRNSMPTAIGNTLASVGDAIARGYGHDNTDYLKQNIAGEQQATEQGLNAFDQGRKGVMQDYLLGRNLIGTGRQDAAYALSQQQLKASMDPTSAVSLGAVRAAELADPAGAAKGIYKGKSAYDLNPALGNIEKGGQIEAERGRYGMLRQNHLDMLSQQLRSEMDKAVSNRSGGIGLQDQKVNQAIDLRKMLNQYRDKDGNYNVPKSQYTELALGLARLLSPTGSVSEQMVNDLRQRTLKGDLNGALGYVTGSTPNGSTQDVLKNLADSIDRQGETAEKLRNNYYEQFRKSAPSELPPEEVNRIVGSGRGNSFTDFLKQEGGTAQAPMTAVNPKTGQRIVSHDGGQSWQPM